MGRFVKGDVVVVPFPFSDLSNSKRRPALVVANLSGDDVVLCQITTVARPDPDAIALSSLEFSQGHLEHPSLIRPNRLFTADGAIITRTVGSLSAKKQQEVTSKLIEIFTR